MPVQFFTNYIELLKDDEYHDITIEVGEDPNVKLFRAHKNILCYRSPYLRQILSSNKENNNVLTRIKLPNVLPEIFQTILEYIYGGILSLNEKTLDFFKILDAADNLHLQELIDYLQKSLIEDKPEWIEQNFGLTHQISSKSNNLLELQEYCSNIMAQYPEKIFNSFDFILLSEDSLVSLIKRDDLQMKEIEVWEQVVKWGLARNPTIAPDPKTWSDNDFETMKNTLQNCLPLIRFFSLSSKEFSQKVRPYQKLLDQQQYEELLSSYLDPGSVFNINILRPRKIKIKEIKIDDSQIIDSKINDSQIIDSKIVNSNIISIVSKWIDKVVTNDREPYLPYKFYLILRGSRDGFTPKKFHELCDGKHNTVTFIKIKGTKEILGGYNPLKWESTNSYGKTENSFIFTFKNKHHIKNAIISKVKDKNYAIFYKYEHGPQFGGDIVMSSSNEFIDYETISYQQDDYEKKLRDSDGVFSMEDYEVFKIVKK
ncbi:uncharacterized protein OCT59_025351 [Rhizophagus irregularis]|uniref:Kelch-like protein 17 n=1 Tax=Rhizophagus irregularis (strain DAOM 197198w) TaxID=1432141 RepID=A0A015KZE6_RHIIW|nr:hypothetical protein RirG_133540 [Rhizophagus irregularis DAOM 197198w]UZO04990.1 hypothetical protein OCT59_025351 [Rhizophagus irregularis]